MSIASLPRPGVGGVPIIPADAVGPVPPADPPIDFHLEEEDGVPPGFVPPADPVLPADPEGYRSHAPLRGRDFLGKSVMTAMGLNPSLPSCREVSSARVWMI